MAAQMAGQTPVFVMSEFQDDELLDALLSVAQTPHQRGSRGVRLKYRISRLQRCVYTHILTLRCTYISLLDSSRRDQDMSGSQVHAEDDPRSHGRHSVRFTPSV